MPATEDELGRAVPDGDDDLVALPERLEWITPDPSEAEIANLDAAGARDEDVGWLEVAMEDMVGVEVEDAVEQLPEQRPQRRGRERQPERLRMVMDELEEVVLGVREDHEDRLVLEDDLPE